MSQVIFTDPRTGNTYTWERNPTIDTEQPGAKIRNIERTSNTANVGAVKQQGDDGPLIFDWQVSVTSTAQRQALWTWYMLCKTQTIYVTDWEGAQYEGQVVFLSEARKASESGYSVFQMQFECYRLISGILYNAGVVP